MCVCVCMCVCTTAAAVAATTTTITTTTAAAAAAVAAIAATAKATTTITTTPTTTAAAAATTTTITTTYTTSAATVIYTIAVSGPESTPRTLSSRVLVAGFWFFCSIIMANYTANLAAFLTTSRLSTPINSLQVGHRGSLDSRISVTVSVAVFQQE